MFESKPLDENFFIDGAPLNDATGCEIEDGPLKGIHIFTSKARAEEFCWKNGFEPVFESEEPTP
jgi:hypothetical protein